MTAKPPSYQVVLNFSPRGNGELEAEISSIRAVAPKALEADELFTAAVTDALSNILDKSTAMALEIYVGKASLGDPDAVFASLDQILGRGAQIVKGAISEEFRLRVHRLHGEIMQRVKDPAVIDGRLYSEAARTPSEEDARTLSGPAKGPGMPGLLEEPGHTLQDDQDVVVRFVLSAKNSISD